jgi:hypothetical protein
MDDRDAQSPIELAKAKLRAACQELESVSSKEPLSAWITLHRAWSEAAADLNRTIAAQTTRLKADNDQMRTRLDEIHVLKCQQLRV